MVAMFDKYLFPMIAIEFLAQIYHRIARTRRKNHVQWSP